MVDTNTAIFSNIPKLKYRLHSIHINKKGVDDHKFDVDSRLEHPSITMTRSLETSSTIFKNMLTNLEFSFKGDIHIDY